MVKSIMTIYDISLTISPDMPVWPGDPPVVLEQVSSMDAGAHDNVSRLACSVHTGTHVDAPHHFLNDHRTVDALPLEVLVGPVEVLQIPEHVDLITAGLLENLQWSAGVQRVLFRTRNSRRWADGDDNFDIDFVGISLEGAEWLVKKRLKLVGIDYLSVAPYRQSTPTHRALLEPGIVLLEGLDLSRVPAGHYDLYCLPLKLSGSDGAPARVILIGE
jgi:arylformamidase